jgi:hypothetical protein
MVVGNLPSCSDGVWTRRDANSFFVSTSVDLKQFVTHLGYRARRLRVLGG